MTATANAPVPYKILQGEIVRIYLLLASFRALLLHCALCCLRINLVAGFTHVPNLAHLGPDRC